jgi:sugar-specific transcriptional regulator TrmB
MDERAVKLLTQYGLSERESTIYLHLLANGSRGAGEIARAVQLRRMEVYRIVKALSDRGMVIASPGKPVKYAPEPIEAVIALLMDQQMKKLRDMEEARTELLTVGKTVQRLPETSAESKFKMIQGREQIYSQMERMIDSSSSSVNLVLTRNDLVQLHLLGASERFRNAIKRGASIKLLSSVDLKTVEAVESLPKGSEMRHSDDFSIGRMLISDGTQILVSLVLDDTQGRKNDRDIAIWTDSSNYAEMMRLLFQKAFSTSVPSEERVREIKGGRKTEERSKAIIDVLKATLSVEGWQVEAPGNMTGASGASYAFPTVLRKGDKLIAADVVLGSSEATAREQIIASIMKGLEIKSGKLYVIASPYTGDELTKLAELVGVNLVDGSDTVEAVSELRKRIGKR